MLDKGTIGNASFVAIPYNSGSKEGAMVVANFLMSPQAQARAQAPEFLGYGTVLDMAALSAGDRALFDALELGVATLSPAELGTAGWSGTRPFRALERFFPRFCRCPMRRRLLGWPF